MPEVLNRVARVREKRISSKRKATRELAAIPYLFGEIRQPGSDYILIPRHSSERRDYIPMGFFDKNYIISDSCLAVPNADLYEFGILMSSMHMVWVKNVCGRIKGDYRYSNEIVYNNFPWPLNPRKHIVLKVKSYSKKVLAIRNKSMENSLSDLYDPRSMPEDLVKAHRKLDKAVESCFRKEPFTNDIKRMEFLINLYEEYV